VFSDGHGWNPPDPATTTIVLVAGGGTVAVATGSDASTSSILVFVATLLVALIAAGAARSRLREELAASAERQKEVLEAESLRLTQRLMHERALSDLAEVRSLLDDAVGAYESFRRDALHVVDAFLGGEARLGRPIGSLAEKWVHAAHIQSRIDLRFPADHPVASTYRTVLMKLREQLNGYDDAPAGLTKGEREKYADKFRTDVDSFNAFCAAARSEVRPPPGHPSPT
jgi:hypothetical protein